MDDRSFWKRVLLECARLQRGSCVVVDGFREQLDELEVLTSECYIQGIYPILKLSLSRQSLEYIKEKKAPEDLQPRHLLAMLDGIEAWICLYGWTDEKGKPIRFPPEFQPSGKVVDKMAKSKVKFVLVMLPPPKDHPLNEVVKKALECDYNRISSIGSRLKKALHDSEDISVGTKYGTDLHFSIQNRPPIVEDGVLDMEDMEENFALQLPSGVVCLHPVETSVNGTVFVKKANDYIFGTGNLEEVTLEFEHGHLANWQARKGSSSIEKFLKKTSGTGDMLCQVCLGINEKVDRYVGVPNIDELRYGAADIAIGDNTPFGESRTIPPVHWHFSLGEISLYVEGKALIRNGEIARFLVK